MARPPNLTPIEFVPGIIPGPFVFKRIYGRSCPCLEIECPKCKKRRWQAASTLRQQIQRTSFDGTCRPCGQSKRLRRERSASWTKTGGRRLGTNGYVEIRFALISDEEIELFDKVRGKTKYVLEHRWIMAKHLGRPLAEDENVHHKNGIRDDNRLENLELWVKSQPCGQRVEDQVVWAKEILRRYEAELEHLPK